MNYLMPAQASAQLISLIVLIAIARWHVIPWLNSRPRADALIALLWVHVFRYVALQVFSAQHDGFPISNGGAMEIVVGDVAGAVVAFIAIALLRRRVRLAIPFVWLLAAETAYDTVTNIHGGVQEHLMGAASGVTWLILVFFVPMVVVSGVLMVWQLYSRKNEELGSNRERDTYTAGAHSAGLETTGRSYLPHKRTVLSDVGRIGRFGEADLDLAFRVPLRRQRAAVSSRWRPGSFRLLFLKPKPIELKLERPLHANDPPRRGCVELHPTAIIGIDVAYLDETIPADNEGRGDRQHPRNDAGRGGMNEWQGVERLKRG